MTRTFGFVASALFSVAVGTATAQSSDPGGPKDGKPRKVDAGACDGSLCRLKVHATGNCTVTVEPEWVFISGGRDGQPVRILWELDRRDFTFPDVGAVMLKPRYAGSFGGNEGLLLGSKVDSQTWEVMDYNFQPSVSRYAVTVVNRKTQETCSVDPGVINDWP
jgi:hypothetical protein